jgi:hypothetical protein
MSKYVRVVFVENQILIKKLTRYCSDEKAYLLIQEEIYKIAFSF